MRKELIREIQKAIFPIAQKISGDDEIFDDCYFMAQAALTTIEKVIETKEGGIWKLDKTQ